METKIKSKNRFMAVFLALLMFLSVLPTGIGLQKVEAATVNVSHQKGNYMSAYGDWGYATGFSMNIPSSAISTLKGIYSSQAAFMTSGGSYTPEARNIFIDNGVLAFCANPVVLHGPNYTDKITVSATTVDSSNYNEFFEQFSAYRYPDAGIRNSLKSKYGADKLYQNLAISYLSGILQKSSVSDETIKKLIDMWEKDRPGENAGGVVDNTHIRSEIYATAISWYFSLDNEVSQLNGGTSALNGAGMNTMLKFYAYVADQIKEGTLALNNAVFLIYSAPTTNNSSGLYSKYQVLNSYSGTITVQDKGAISLKKVSSNPDYTNGNSNYSLAGAEYGVYSDKALTKKVGTLTTKVDGSSNVLEGLKTGTYFVKETKASKGFLLDPETYQVIVKPNETTTVKSTEVPANGNLELKKSSSKPEYSEGNNNYTLAGAEYVVYSDKGLTKKVDTLITKADGSTNVLKDILAGTYYVREEKASKGFHKDENVYTVEVKSGETTTVKSVEIPLDDPVAVVLQKQDATTGLAVPQGDASLALAEFTLKFYAGNYADGVDPSTSGIAPTRTWVLRTDGNGKSYLSRAGINFSYNGQSYPYKVSGDELYLDENNAPTLPLGTLTIQETKAPEGYHMPDSATVHVRKIEESDEILETVKEYNIPVEAEQVILGDFTLFKGNTDAEQAEIIKPEVGAEFVAIAKKYVNQYGSFEEALNHLSEYGVNEYSVLVTDSEGNAKSGKLAYGDYLMKQTKGEDELQMLNDLVSVSIRAEGDTKHFNINNPSNEYYAQLIKKDSVTGEVVILNSASFKIKNKATGEYVTMKVGKQTYDTFKTTAVNSGEIPAGTFYVATEEQGTTVTPLKLKAGVYIVEEVETPEGYYLLEEPIEFTVGKVTVDEVDDDLDEIIKVEIENKPQYGELTINKVGELFKEWVKESVTLPVQKSGTTEKVEVEVPRANEGLTLTKSWTITKEVEELVTVKEAEIIPAKEAVIDPETGEELEPAVPEQIIPAVEEIVKKTIEEEQNTSETVTTDETGSFSREVSEVGTYTLTDKAGNVVATITLADSETGTISVTLPADTRVDEEYKKGEVVDETFEYYKATYEEGYLEGAEFELIAKEDIKSYDGKTEFYKKGDKLLFAQKDIIVNGKTLYKKGEVITVPTLDEATLKNKELVDNKVKTENASLVISRIPLGDYDLIEVNAPAGYVKDETVRNFTFTPQEKTILVDLKETEPILNIRQKLNVFLAKSLQSSEYFEDRDFSNIVIGMYTKEEILGLAKDSLVAVVAPNEAGAMSVSDIPEGNYYFKEISTKDGYILSDSEYDVSVKPDESATEEDKVKVVPEPVVNEQKTKDIKVVKVDKDTKKPLVGVVFNLFKLEDNGEKTPIKNSATGEYTFITDENGQIVIKGLPFGTYSLEEVKTADGYIKDEGGQSVAVGDDSELEVVVTNEVTTIGFRKIDAKTGLPVVGAKLKLVDADGNDVYLDSLGYVTTKENGTLAEWVTDGGLFYVKGLKIDHGYKVIEVEAPEGYHKGEDLGFTVNGNSGLQLNDYPNMPYEPEIKTQAFNKDTMGKQAHAIKKANITDIVDYVDLIPGRSYKAKAVLVLASDPTQIVAEAEIEFVPETKDGQIEVDFGMVDLTLLAGENVVVFESVIDLKTNEVIGEHKDPNDPDQTVEIEEPEVGTKATFDNDKKESHAVSELTVIDTVSYKNLVIGEEYTIKGVLVDKENPENVIAESEVTFVAETKDGEVKMEFVFDASKLAGKELVVFETLFYKDEVIGEHKDPNDPEQTVEIEEPNIGTKASTEDGKDSTKPNKETVIIDTVSFENLVVGEEYTVKGVLMDKSTGKPILVNGEEVRAELTFVAETKDGTVELTFKFDSTGLAGKDLVVFEEIYYKGELIEEHKDINDKDQTIKIVAEILPKKPTTNDDSINPVYYIAGGVTLMLLAVLVITKMIKDKKKEVANKKSE